MIVRPTHRRDRHVRVDDNGANRFQRLETAFRRDDSLNESFGPFGAFGAVCEFETFRTRASSLQRGRRRVRGAMRSERRADASASQRRTRRRRSRLKFGAIKSS